MAQYQKTHDKHGNPLPRPTLDNKSRWADLDDDAAEPSAPTIAVQPEPQPQRTVRSDITAGTGYEWLDDMDSAPVDGTQVYLSADARGAGLLCYARQSRRSVNFKWEQVRIWSDAATRLTVTFTPKYWRAA